jgi:hypothetical protein
VGGARGDPVSRRIKASGLPRNALLKHEEEKSWCSRRAHHEKHIEIGHEDASKKIKSRLPKTTKKGTKETKGKNRGCPRRASPGKARRTRRRTKKIKPSEGHETQERHETHEKEKSVVPAAGSPQKHEGHNDDARRKMKSS